MHLHFLSPGVLMLDTMHRLHPRGPANPGICVDREGAMLGPDCVLVSRTSRGFRGIDRQAASALHKCGLGAEYDADWLFRQCERIADSLNKGEIALAQIYGLRIPVGGLDNTLLKRLAAEGFTKWSFNPDELRIPKGDPHGGEWTTGGDGAPASTLPAPPEQVFADFAAGDESGAPIAGTSGAVSSSDTSSGSDGASGGSTYSDGPPLKFEFSPLPLLPASPAETDDPSVPAIAALAGGEAQWLAGELTPTTFDALKLLMARMSGPGIVFGALFIPTNNSPIIEGKIAGSPDLSYRYDSDTGILQLRQDIGSLGPAVLDEAHIGTDGLFRDADGTVIGRYLAGSGVVVELGGLAGDQTPLESDRDQPKLCPDPNAESTAGRSERSLAYQEQITGLPRGLEVTLNGIRFDGCIEADGTMLEAKGPGFEDKMDGSDDWEEWYQGAKGMMVQMQRQSDAVTAAGTTVEWHFAEQSVADFFRKFAEENGLTNVVVIYTPPRRR